MPDFSKYTIDFTPDLQSKMRIRGISEDEVRSVLSSASAEGDGRGMYRLDGVTEKGDRLLIECKVSVDKETCRIRSVFKR